MESNALNFQEITNGLATKSSKIRALGQAGAATSEIARFLGIRYQHARNVLVDAGLLGGERQGQVEMIKSTPPAASGIAAASSQWTAIDEAGKLQLGPAFLARAGLAPGHPVYVGVTEAGLELLSRSAAIARAQKIAAPYRRPGVSEVDSFIAERRGMWGEK